MTTLVFFKYYQKFNMNIFVIYRLILGLTLISNLKIRLENNPIKIIKTIKKKNITAF